MDAQFFGANCIALTTKQARVVIDDNLVDLGGKSASKAGDITLFTSPHGNPRTESKIVIDSPGEYEVSGVSIYGIPARSHLDESSQKNAVMYKLILDDIKVLILGHIYPELSDKQLENIGMVDVMFVPVGGNGYTTDPVGALKLIKKIEPKLVVPTNYDDAKLNYPVPQQSLEEAIKVLAMEPKETTNKLKIKAAELGESTQLAIIEP